MVSYDPTRELYQDYNAAFARHWKETKGKDVIINQSARRLRQADARGHRMERRPMYVTLALAPQYRRTRTEHGLVAKNWQSRLPDNSSPYTTTIVFVVRKGNPKGDSRLARSRQTRRSGDYAKPQDFRRRALGVSRGVGLRS
jgi:sulfate transport system substrate-binding protein